MKITEAQLFIINNIIASLANAFSNILTPPESVHSHFPPIRFSGRFPDPGGKSPEGRTYLLNPGMSKMRGLEKQTGKKRSSQYGTLGAVPNFGLFWARGTR